MSDLDSPMRAEFYLTASLFSYSHIAQTKVSALDIELPGIHKNVNRISDFIAANHLISGYHVHPTCVLSNSPSNHLLSWTSCGTYESPAENKLCTVLFY
ncbi:hypothetical protein SERLA73DRAFT_184612 [Serpula lacrymans var. lacrymans S7.3]|uniref:Uncharacterized protein n=1 Tax=Serpula lacrymans var. lacrymans (strain S7.3) TaxID=936435 RepID=F8Q4Q5_SERL3|nr:hypothetical protein SERLA73DRAFT_184612 [Serpula lacrymans var. lacrymans S7.3]